jgi:hypothetical protein
MLKIMQNRFWWCWFFCNPSTTHMLVDCVKLKQLFLIKTIIFMVVFLCPSKKKWVLAKSKKSYRIIFLHFKKLTEYYQKGYNIIRKVGKVG